MSKIAIVTDSTAYIPKDLLSQFPIFTIPLTLHWDERILVDGIDIQPEEFYKQMKSSKTFPVSAPPTPEDFARIYKDVLDQGYDIFSIHLSAKLSQTIESAKTAKKLLASERIAIFDSRGTSMMLGFQALAVARAAAAGAGLRQCLDLAEKGLERSGLYFVVHDLEYLQRGGRIGGAAALLGQLLNLKPILTVKNGETAAVERVSGMNRAIDRMLDLVDEDLKKWGNPIHISSLYSDNLEDAHALIEKAKKRYINFQVEDALFSPLSPVIGSHVGPGTVGFCYSAGL